MTDLSVLLLTLPHYDLYSMNWTLRGTQQRQLEDMLTRRLEGRKTRLLNGAIDAMDWKMSCGEWRTIQGRLRAGVEAKMAT